MRDVSIIMALSRCTVETVVNKAVNNLGFSSLKPQQKMAIDEFINGRDMFIVLPTALGKIVFYLPSRHPMAFDELYPDSKQLSRTHMLTIQPYRPYCNVKMHKFHYVISLLNKNNCIPMAPLHP